MKMIVMVLTLLFLSGCNSLRNATWRLMGGDPHGQAERFVNDRVEDVSTVE